MGERAQGNRPCFTKKVVVNGVEYREVKPKKAMLRALELTQHCLRAVDGSKKVIVGPEDLVDELGLSDKYYYVSELGDYYRGGYEQRLMVAGLKSAVVKTLSFAQTNLGSWSVLSSQQRTPLKHSRR